MALNPGGYTRYIGYTWKLCPYSSAYKTLFYDNGFCGPSAIAVMGVTLPTSVHTTTEGRLVYDYNRSTGWICNDPLCPYYISNGMRFTES